MELKNTDAVLLFHAECEVEKEQEQVSRMVTPSSEVILKSRRCHKRVALNVGGVRHEVTWRLLEQYPQSRWI